MSFEAFAQYHEKNKVLLKKFIIDYLDAKVQQASSPLALTAFERLRDFATRGKLLRGGFVLFAHDMYEGAELEDALRVATVMELSQSAVLIHDDIMDNDRLRRGHPSLFAQYESDALHMGLKDPQEYGKSMGLVVGDLGLFMTYELMGDVKATAGLMHVYSHIMTDLGIGQMFDYQFGMSTQERSLEEIRHMYALKTGSYTFVLPFLLGALLAGASESEQKKLKEITHHLGVVFQIKDDELDIYGDQDKIGKPLGSDIREEKKTILRAMLLSRCTPSEARSLTTSSVEDVQKLLEKYAIDGELKALIAHHSQQALEGVTQLHIAQTHRTLFETLIHYNTQRTS